MKSKLALPFIILVLLMNPAGARSQEVDIEAEDYTDSHDIAYNIIQSENSSSCSGGLWVVGLDYPGEWVEYKLALSSFGTFSPQLRLQADAAVDFHMRMTLLPPKIGDPQVIDFSFTGKGYV